MTNRAIRHINFVIRPDVLGGAIHYGLDGIDYTVANNLQLLVHQQRPEQGQLTVQGAITSFGLSDGYIGRGRVFIHARNFWQKFPQALEYSQNQLIYRQWYGKGNTFDTIQANGVIERLQDENLSGLLHLHQGDELINNTPINGLGLNGEWADRFYALMRQDEGIQEEDISFAKSADMEGIAIQDDIAIRFSQNDPLQFSQLWQRNPVGRCEQTYISSTLVVDFAEVKTDFPVLEKFMEDSITGYTDPNRFKDYGRFIYGASHRTILPLFERCSFHRIMPNGYYSELEIPWLMYMRGASDTILQLARESTARCSSIGMVNYNHEYTAAGPEVRYHNPGAFYYRGLWWGDSYGQPPIPGINNHGGWSSRILRIPDPDGLLWSWILDGNACHLDAYKRWYRFTRDKFLRTDEGVREGNYRGYVKELVYAMTAFEYYANHPIAGWAINAGDEALMMDYCITYTRRLLTIQLSEATGALFHPLWMSRLIDFYELYLPDPAVRNQIISEILDFVVDNYNSNFIKDAKTLDMAVILDDIIDNRFPFYTTYSQQEIQSIIKIEHHTIWLQKLKEKILTEPGKWRHFGMGNGELGDSFLKLQWGRFLKLLRRNNLTEINLPAYNYSGLYPASALSSTFHPDTIGFARGNEILILNQQMQPIHFNFKIPGSGYSNGGGFNPREIWVVTPQRHELNKLINRPTQKLGSHFICVTNDQTRTEDNYNAFRLRDLQARGKFDSYTPPIHINNFSYNWDQSNLFLSPTGTEDFTFQHSHIPSDGDGAGIYRVLVDGRNVYSGIVSDQFPEAMHLIPNYPDSGQPDSRWNYIFSDCNFYLKNLQGSRQTVLNFWVSVDKAYHASDGRSNAGCFARVVAKNLLGQLIISRELQFEGTELGYHNDADDLMFKHHVTINLGPGEAIQLSIVLIYQSTVVRLELDGHLLCARKFQDIDAFSPHINDILQDPWTSP